MLPCAPRNLHGTRRAHDDTAPRWARRSSARPVACTPPDVRNASSIVGIVDRENPKPTWGGDIHGGVTGRDPHDPAPIPAAADARTTPAAAPRDAQRPRYAARTASKSATTLTVARMAASRTPGRLGQHQTNVAHTTRGIASQTARTSAATTVGSRRMRPAREGERIRLCGAAITTVGSRWTRQEARNRRRMRFCGAVLALPGK